MKDGTASHTARSAAARRLEYERAASVFGPDREVWGRPAPG